jgi:DNA modification methylase
MPESVTDRFSKKHEYFFFMVKSERYYFDLDAIRDKSMPNISRTKGSKMKDLGYSDKWNFETNGNNPLGKNPGSVSDFWDIPTKPSSAKHYASYNDSLLTKPVLAGCPEGGIIYDPFMGTGSTAEVALRTNRKFIGSEMSAEYCKIAEKRLRKFTVESLF